jgi:two-component system response regulator RegA
MHDLDLAPSILIVDDDGVFRSRLARAFRERGYEAREAGTREEAAASARGDAPEYAVVDLRLPDGSGLEVVRDLTALDEAIAIVVLTGYGSIATALDALRLGATNYLTKPSDVEEIIAAFTPRTPSTDELATADHEPPSLARVEWEHINRVLADSGGNISEAARRLGIHRRSLQRKLAKYPTRR